MPLTPKPEQRRERERERGAEGKRNQSAPLAANRELAPKNLVTRQEEDPG
jgi:hypothetical protein